MLNLIKWCESSLFRVKWGAYEGELTCGQKSGKRKMAYVSQNYSDEEWKNGKGHSAILVCILIFIFDQLILNWKFNKINFTWYYLLQT